MATVVDTVWCSIQKFTDSLYHFMCTIPSHGVLFLLLNICTWDTLWGYSGLLEPLCHKCRDSEVPGALLLPSRVLLANGWLVQNYKIPAFCLEWDKLWSIIYTPELPFRIDLPFFTLSPSSTCPWDGPTLWCLHSQRSCKCFRCSVCQWENDFNSVAIL